MIRPSVKSLPDDNYCLNICEIEAADAPGDPISIPALAVTEWQY